MILIRVSADTEIEMQAALAAISESFIIERCKKPKQGGSGRYKCYLFSCGLRENRGSSINNTVNK